MSYAAEVAADSPLTWYRMDAPSGVTENDLGSLNLDGTYVNTPTLAESGVDSPDTSVRFTKTSSEYLAGSDHDSYSILTTGELSVEWWAKFDVDADSGVAERMVGKIATGQWEWLSERYSNGFHAVRLFNGTSTFIVHARFGRPSLDVWHHHVFTVNAATEELKLYLDGALADTQSFDSLSLITNGTAPIQVGAGDTSFYVNGWMDEVAVYGTVLSAARILAHYEALFPPPAPEEPEEPEDPEVPVVDNTDLDVFTPANLSSTATLCSEGVACSEALACSDLLGDGLTPFAFAQI